ncbi:MULTISPECIES: YigZ family protein [unclassified Achromobacter]|uniref:IMPACT family protein n=1 Tax=unclassified Achromobacter TaxID=2626865 RepID=UPI000B518F65|nr:MULTISPECIES: YigZ family protein [unclassified Achromobacter]OWT77576.1 thymidylate synthase [Achromobacter sp. HZ28]OWT78625.1 thymidylate synthase [Achromobacter sp. HZ34]
MATTLAQPGEYQETIKKSLFLALAAPVADAQAAMDFIASRSDADATHNCWAYRVGDQYRFNDDGEPGGSAGRPILQAIDGQQCDRVAVLVIRWYGGIKLGTGGLVRAYGGCAANCLRLAPRVEIIEMVRASCHCAYGDLQWLQSRLVAAGAAVVSENFDGEGATLTLDIPRVAVADLAQAITDATRGRSSLELGQDQAQ